MPLPLAALAGLAGVGGLGAGLFASKSGRNAMLGTPDKRENIDLYTPQQQGMQSRLAQLGIGGIEQLYPQMMQDPYKGFDALANEARTNFQQQTLPTIAERFTQMGAQRSSAFPQQLGAAGAGLDQGLASMKSQYGQQMMGMQGNFLQSLLGSGLQQQFQPSYQQGSQGALAPLLQLLAKLGGGYMGGLL